MSASYLGATTAYADEIPPDLALVATVIGLAISIPAGAVVSDRRMTYVK